MIDQWKKEWAEFISRSPARRYLYARGMGELIALEEGLRDDGRLMDFLRLLASERDARLIGVLHYLLQPRLAAFYRYHLPGLLRGLTHVAKTDVQVSGTAGRGKILWAHTACSRLSGRIDAGSYILRRPERTPNRPENQLLKLFLEKTSTAIDSVVEVIGKGRLPDELREVKEIADRALLEPRMRDVQRTPAITVQMKRLAYRHRDWRYREVADLCAALDSLLVLNRWEVVLTMLASGWIAPLDPDDLFELYALVLMLDILTEQLGFHATRYGLIRAGRKEVAVLKRGQDGPTVRVFFDQSPDSIFGRISRYSRVVRNNNGLEGRGRRPDIIMCAEFADRSERIMLMEVKKTRDGRYKRDSVYKAFSYLYDFADLWRTVPEQTPKIILLFPAGVSAVQQVLPIADRPDLALISADDRTRLVSTLTTILYSTLGM